MSVPRTIRTKADWIATARYVVPLLPAYMASQRNVDSSRMERDLNDLLSSEDWTRLRRLFHQIWAWLPDNPGIHRHPFGLLCDLCSEDWVFSEETAA